MEIGIQNGGSLEIWSKYFENATFLVGCDINPDCTKLQYDDARISVVVADANTNVAQQAILKHTHEFNIIIDDGSHRSSDIIKTFSRYFDYLSDNGVFVIEDLHCSYWQEFEGGLYDPYSSISFFKCLTDIVNYESWGVDKTRKNRLAHFSEKYAIEFNENMLAQIHSVEFVNSVCIIRKSAANRSLLGQRIIAGDEANVLPEIMDGRGMSFEVLNQEESLSGTQKFLSEIDSQNKIKEAAQLNERVKQLQEDLHDALISKDASITTLKQLLSKKDECILQLDRDLVLQESRLRELGQKSEGREADAARTLSNLERSINEKQQTITQLTETVEAYLQSTSWKITKPLRIGGRIIRATIYPFRLIKSGIRHGGGVTNTLKKAKRIYVNEGFAGIQRSIRVITHGHGIANHELLQKNVVTSTDIARQIFHEQQTEFTYDELRDKTESLSYKPLISVLMPVYNTPAKWLIRAIESLQDQVYENWELCVVDDCSATDEQRQILERFAQKDVRVKYHFAPKNQGISASSNIALEMAAGEYIALIDHDDEVTPDAFYWIAKSINEEPGADFIYTDECKIDDTQDRNLFQFIFKPKWSPELMFNGMLTGHLTAYKAEIVKKIGGFRAQFDFSQDYDLALRVSEVAKKIIHIERILYLWRAIPGSAARGGKDFAKESNIAALNDFLKRNHVPGVASALAHANCVTVNIPDNVRVSIIIPSDSYENLKLAIVSIIEKTDFSNYEIVAVCNSPLADKLSNEFSDINKYVFSRYDKKYNFSDKCNQGARDASGEFVVFYNDDVFPIERNWLTKLIEYLYIPGVEATSPKLLHKDKTIQYAGMISGTPGLCGTAYNGIPVDADDNFLSLHKYVRNISILSGACCALRKKIFLEIGGFDAINTPDGHSDVDLSYKLLDAGYRCVYTPYSLLFHIGNHSWGYKKDKYKADIFCLKRWGRYISQDDYFTDSMKRVLYRDFQFNYKIYAGHINPSVSYKSKDVLFISHELSLTGAPRMLFYAALAVKSDGGFPVVVAPQDGPMRAEFERAGITVIIDESIASGHFLFEGFARNFDVVVVNTIVLHPVVKQLSNIDILKTIWWLHEAQSLEIYLRQYSQIRADHVRILCVSDYAQSFVPASYKSDVLYNGVPKLQRVLCLKEETDLFTFILVGTIESRKGQDIFVEAISLLPESIRSACRFLMAGNLSEANKPYWNQVMDKANHIKEITYLGLLDHKKLLDETERSDVVVCASRDEPFSLSTIEAAMLAKVTILNENVGTAAVFKHKESCLMFDSGSSESLAEQMIYAFENKKRIKEMGQAAMRVYESELTIEQFSKNFLDYVDA